jgi:hypothetical protein
MRDGPHFGGLTMQSAPVSGCLQPESALVCRQIKRGKNQEKEA